MSDDDAELNDHEISRRALLERGAALAAFLAFPGERRRVFGAADGRVIAERPYLEAARGAERWIARLAIRDGRGTAWPADPDDVTSVQHNLYTGSPGIVLLYLELHAATGEPAYLAQAAAG